MVRGLAAPPEATGIATGPSRNYAPGEALDACLSEDVVAALVEGTLDEARFLSAERHIAECTSCLELVAQVGRALVSRGSSSAVTADETPDLVRGAVVGRYEILELLGAGAMGRVYAAQDPALDRKVALKVLRPGSATADLEARLLREAKAMARLSHPEVITIHDVGRHDQQLFIAMELDDGGTLRQWLAATTRPWREILAVYLRAGRGLARAHAAGIIHRDFKPDNVLIGEDGRVRVTDFGLAREVEAVGAESERPLEEASTMNVTLTRTGTLLGTPAYMAPEQLTGAPADARSDLYSFCVALHEALCGARPFAGTTLRALQEAKVAGTVGRKPAGIGGCLRASFAPWPSGSGLAPGTATNRWTRCSRRSRGRLGRLRGRSRRSRSVSGAIGVAGAEERSPHAVRARSRRSPDRPAARATAPASSRTGALRSSAAELRPLRASPSPPRTAWPGAEPQDLESDDTVWLGSMFPTKGPSADDFGVMNLGAVELARSEIARTTKALDGPRAAQHVRRIAPRRLQTTASMLARAARSSGGRRRCPGRARVSLGAGGRGSRRITLHRARSGLRSRR